MAKNKVENEKKQIKNIVIKSAILLLLFGILFGLSTFLVLRFLSNDNKKVINYNEKGNLDYKVYLKENDFYETEYLTKGMYYIASLIDKIDIDFTYDFSIDDKADMDFSYRIVGNLKITDELEKNTFFQKEYVLLETKNTKLTDEKKYSLNQNLSIDYNYYNKIANDFKSIYGLDTSSSLTIYLVIDKNVKNADETLVYNNNQISVKIPLSQRAIDIKMDDTGIENSKAITKEQPLELSSYIFVVLAIILFIFSVATLLKLLEVLTLLMPKKSKYEKYIERILKEYDRLIAETLSAPKFNDKNIVKIGKIEELLDIRDNLKLPIMYYNEKNKNESYFYIEKDNNLYLMTVKEKDINV